MNIVPLYTQSTAPTAQVVCLITPDRERTLRSFLGASQEMKAEDLKPEQFENVKLVHIEGYSLLNESLTERAMELAKEAKAKISFDLASFEITQAYKDKIIYLLSHYVDILFANEAETKMLTGLSPEKGSDILKDICQTVIILQGSKGCWVARRETKFHHPAFSVQSIDTTGAGDLFASGFLHGYLSQSSLQECARFGSLIGAAAVQYLGAEIPAEKWEEIKKQTVS